MTGKRKTTSSPKTQEKVKQKTQAMPRTSVRKGKDPKDPKKKLSARVVASAQKAKKKEEVSNAMKHTQPDTGIPDAPRLEPQVEEDPKDIYFRALGARIAQKAYGLYEARGKEQGHDLEDWLEAERQILSEEAIR